MALAATVILGACGRPEGGTQVSPRRSSPKLQALITTTEGLEVTPESGFSTRTW